MASIYANVVNMQLQVDNIKGMVLQLGGWVGASDPTP